MKRVLIVDNDDSFTYNLVQLVKESHTAIETVVVRSHKEVTLEEVQQYSHIIFSPGPSLPKDHPMMFEILEEYESSKVFLGVCLGHQAIGEFYGGKLKQLDTVVHGQQKEISWNNEVSRDIKMGPSLKIGLYHSWYIESIDPKLPLTVVSRDKHDRIMAIRHPEHAIFGVQFHPESIMTEGGETLMSQWLEIEA